MLQFFQLMKVCVCFEKCIEESCVLEERNE